MSYDAEHFAPGLSKNPSAFEDVWRRLPRLGRVVLWLVAISLVVQVAASLVSGVTGSSHPTTGQGSSLDTTSSGTAAFVRLLTLNGHAVVRLATNLSPGMKHPFGDLFSLGATTWSAANTLAVEGLLAHGDTVSLSGPVATLAVLKRIAPASHVRWSESPANIVTSFAPTPVTSGVEQVNSPGPGTFVVTSESSRVTILARGSGGVLALALHDGDGLLVVLASSSPLWNQNLASVDNAAFGLNLAGRSHAVDAFDEFTHGDGVPGRGLASLPGPWRWGLGAALLSLLVWIVSASRRFGPPQATERKMLPPRIGYVDAMATRLGTRPDDEIVASTNIVRDELRVTLARRFGLPYDASDEQLHSVASYSAGGNGDVAEMVALVVNEPTDRDDALGAARALALLRRPRSSQEENE